MPEHLVQGGAAGSRVATVGVRAADPHLPVRQAMDAPEEKRRMQAGWSSLRPC